MHILNDLEQYNQVYSWGNNCKGQLALPEEVKLSYYPMKVDALSVLEDDFA